MSHLFQHIGHGTATPVGDRVEIGSLAQTVGSHAGPRTVGMTSLKSIVGHTKAAAGVGAFIKAVIAVNQRVVPPTAGCIRPNELFDSEARMLYPVCEGQVLPPDTLMRAGVSAMGFGGMLCFIIFHFTTRMYISC